MLRRIRDEGPDFKCSTAECDATAYDEEQLPECIVCKKRFCIDGPEAGPGGCLRWFGAERYCPGCATCACGQDALIACDECGTLVCGQHIAIHPLRNECKPCRRKRDEREDEEYRRWTAYYGSQYYGGWNRDPKDGRYKPQAVINAAAQSERKPAVSEAAKKDDVRDQVRS